MIKKIRAFNFVELLLVMMILGVVISLTMPLLQGIKDDDKINKSYMRKATQDVSDALALAMMKKPQLTGLDRMEFAGFKAGTTVDSTDLRNVFNTAIPATPCNVRINEGDDTPKSCGIDTTFNDDDKKTINKDTPGFTVGGKMVMMFLYEHTAASDTKPESFGYVFVDVNGKKSPNELNKDRYVFKLYNDKAVLLE